MHHYKKTSHVKSLWVFVFATALITLWGSDAALAQNGKGVSTKSPIILALNAYSFNDLLLAKDPRDKQTLYSLFNLMDWCAVQKIAAVDLTGYYFPNYPAVPSDEYIARVRDKAKQLGIVISGTGIRNNFASPDPAVRAADVALAKKWIEVAAKLGAPVLRLFAGEIPKGYENKWDEVAAWMIDCYKECAAHGEKYGVKIGIQNHGDMLQTAEQCIKVLKAVDSKWAGLIVDTGNFKTPDPYVDIEAVVPYAVNWQVKESAFGIGNALRTDFVRLMGILKKTGYRGYLPVETLLVRGKPYDPFALVPEILNDLTLAMQEVYQGSKAYQGKPWNQQAQQIPGKIQCEWYDLGGEGIAYHDQDSINNGSGKLNPANGTALNEFRMFEGVDISYTKARDIDNSPFNLVEPTMGELYTGWTSPGEWINYTINVNQTGTYTLGLMYTASGDGKIALLLDGKALTADLLVPSTKNDQETIAWRQWHHWNRLNAMATFKLKKGVHVLTLKTVANGNMNYDYFEFTLKPR